MSFRPLGRNQFFLLVSYITTILEVSGWMMTIPAPKMKSEAYQIPSGTGEVEFDESLGAAGGFISSPGRHVDGEFCVCVFPDCVFCLLRYAMVKAREQLAQIPTAPREAIEAHDLLQCSWQEPNFNPGMSQ